MNGINEKIDRHVIQERRKAIIAVIVSLVIAIPVLSIFLFPNMGTTSQTTGVVVRLVALPTDEGQDLYLVIKLKNGDKIRSFIPNSSFYKKGKKVKLEKQESLLFGRPTYRFRGYVDNHG